MRAHFVAGLLVALFVAPAGAADPTAPAAAKRRQPRTEVEWEICEIVADIAEMASFAKTKALDPKLQVEVVDQPSTKGLWVAVQTSGSEAPLVSEIATGDFTVSFEAYAGITAELLARVGLRAEGTTPSDGAALLQRLTDFTLAEIQKENERVSAWLTREPLNPAAHEEAALILGALGLKERAGLMLGDRREVCLKAAAHLTLAAALRGDRPAGAAGRMAREVVLDCYGDDAGVVDRVKAWRASGKLSAGEQAWLNALTLDCIGDWHMLDKPLTASLLERIMHFKALCFHVSDLAALEFLRKRNTETIADWGQISMAGSFPVETGNIFAQTTLVLVLKDLTETYKAAKGRSPLPSDRLADILSAAPTRAVEVDGQGARLAVIPWSTWSRYFERHVVHAALNMHHHFVGMLGLPEDGKKFREQAERLLKGVTLEPLVVALFIDDKLLEEKGGKPTPRWKADPEAMRAAYAFIESSPQRITAPMWYYVTESGATHPPGARGYHAWFAISQAGPLDVTHTPFAAYNVSSVPGARLELLMTRMPSSFRVLETGAERLKRTPTTVAQFDQLYSRLLETDVAVMLERAAFLWSDVDAYRHEFEKIAALNPDKWCALAKTLVEKGRDDEAAIAYQREMDGAYDRVTACNNAKWLVDYYLDKNEVEEARKVATMADGVGCSAGFEAMAMFHERQRHYDDAERFYKKMAERYSEEDALLAFYARHEKENARFKTQAAEGLRKVFPEGLDRVKLSEFAGAPSDGVEVQSESERSRKIGITKGVVIGALDGYRVHSIRQYGYVGALSVNPEVALIYWDGTAWRETKGRGRLRRVGAMMGTYAPKK